MHVPAGSCWLLSPRITGNFGNPERWGELTLCIRCIFNWSFLCSMNNAATQRRSPYYSVNNKKNNFLRVLPSFSRKRAPYIAYLTRCRQGLQTSQAHLERLVQRVLRDKEVANRYFTTVCVRLLLEHMESKMLDFIKGISKFSSRCVLQASQCFSCYHCTHRTSEETVASIQDIQFII